LKTLFTNKTRPVIIVFNKLRIRRLIRQPLERNQELRSSIFSEYYNNKGEIMMTVMVEVEKLQKMEAEIARLQRELRALQSEPTQGFERLDTDVFLTEVYNG